MQFRTEYQAAFDPALEIRHDTPVWLVGSCFSDNVGERLHREGFDVEINPLGTLYNPLSIARALREVCECHLYTPGDIFEHQGRWHSMMRHSRFSDADPAVTLARINDSIIRLHDALPRLEMLIITLGSSIGFHDREDGRIVANCHKLPDSRFERREQSVDLIVAELTDTIDRLRSQAPRLRIMFTVSPIRHKGYGMVRDRLSKSRLLLAVDQLVSTHADVSYFPAYEIMMDDLRDYRFYASDMIHPTDQAVDYIYDHFCTTTMRPATRTEAATHLRAHLRATHRPR